MPQLSVANQEATDVWSAMGGWFPERLPVILAFFPVEHLDGLFERLLCIRSRLARTDDE